MFDPASWIQERFFSLEHEYDPVKAHEYYMKNRVLKGRKRGSIENTGEGRSGPKATFDVAPAKGGPVKSTTTAAPASQTSNAAALREAATKRQAQLRARLERLEAVLAQLTEQAKVAAGVETKDSSSSTEKEKDSTDSKKEKEKPKTAAEKKEAAKKARENYEKNKDPETNDSAQDIQDKIEEVQKKIADARESLRQAIERARAKKPPPKQPTFSAAPVKNSGGPVKTPPKSGPAASTRANFDKRPPKTA